MEHISWIHSHNKIVVTQKRMRDIKCIDSVPLSYFTTNESEGTIKVISKKDVNSLLYIYVLFLLTLSSVEQANKSKPTIAIYPSGWTSEFLLGNFDIQYEKGKLIYVVFI